MLSFRQYLVEFNTLLSTNPAFKTYLKMRETLSPEEKKKLLETGYNELLPKLKEIENQLKQLISSCIPSKGMPVRPTILTGIKPPKSIISKVVTRGKDLNKLSDLVRGAVLFLDEKEVQAFIRSVKLKHPELLLDHEEKKRGSDPKYGYYGSHHLSFFMNGVTVELQVMTKKLWAMKSNAHDIYNTTRENPFGPSSADKHISKKIFDMGNRSRYRVEELEYEQFKEFAENLVEYRLDKHQD